MAEQETMLQHLESASQKIDAFRDQLRVTDGSGFYNGFTKQEALRIFSTYDLADNNFTRLYKDPFTHRVSVIDYRKAYSGHCLAIAEDFRLAAASSEDPSVSKQLVMMADVLQDPSIPWEELYKASLKTVASPIRPYLGWEEYDDPWKTKSTPIFWVDQLLPDETEKMKKYIDRARSAYRINHRDDAPRVYIRVGEALITSGMYNEMRFSANTQPNSIEWVREDGAVIDINESTREINFARNLLPFARKYIAQGIVSKYTDEQLSEAHKRLLALHEQGHPFTSNEFGDMKELRDLRLIFHEIYPTTLALSLAQQFDKDYLEQMLIIAVGWGISDFMLADNPYNDDYARGEAGAMIGFGLKNGGFEIINGIEIGWSSVPRALQTIKEFNALIREPMGRKDSRRAREILQSYNGMPDLYDLIRRRGLREPDHNSHSLSSITPA